MIQYKTGTWGVRFAFQIAGSVFHKSCLWGLSSAFIAIGIHVLMGAVDLKISGIGVIWSGYNFVLGFLVVFRNNQAYSRFWEGAALIHQVRGEWMNAISSLVAFCDQSEDKKHDVATFQHLVIRLMSMLHCSALQLVAQVEDDSFEIIAPEGIENSCLSFLISRNDRCEVLLQWIQRVIVEAEQSKALKIAPPILSRVFQELSRGMVNLHNVRKIKEVPFPYPYAQTMALMLIFHWVCTPIIATQMMDSVSWCAGMSFLVVTSFWSLYYIALEIEQPFGEDPNDLPVAEMQRDMNRSLSLLLEPQVQRPPSFELPRHEGNSLVFQKSYSSGGDGTSSSAAMMEKEERFLNPDQTFTITQSGHMTRDGPTKGHSTCSMGDVKKVTKRSGYRASLDNALSSITFFGHASKTRSQPDEGQDCGMVATRTMEAVKRECTSNASSKRIFTSVDEIMATAEKVSVLRLSDEAADQDNVAPDLVSASTRGSRPSHGDREAPTIDVEDLAVEIKGGAADVQIIEGLDDGRSVMVKSDTYRV